MGIGYVHFLRRSVEDGADLRSAIMYLTSYDISIDDRQRDVNRDCS